MPRPRGWRIILIDGPEGISAYNKGRSLGEPEFDDTRFLESSQPAEIRQVVMRIAEQERVRIVIPGFELFTVAARQAHDWLALPTLNAVTVIERFRQKALQRERLKADGRVRQPRFTVCRTRAQFDAAADTMVYPAVLKLDDSGGSLGVYRADSASDARAKYAALIGLNRDNGLPTAGVVLIEELIDGPEFSLQGVVDRSGRLTLVGMSKKTITNGNSGDRFLESQHLVCPPEVIPGPFHAMAEDAVSALGLIASPFHIDLRAPAASRCSSRLEPGLAGPGFRVCCRRRLAATGLPFP